MLSAAARERNVPVSQISRALQRLEAGYGVRLVEHVFERYGAQGVKCFTLEVDAANRPALGLYDKLGFRRYATTTYYQAPAQPAPRGERMVALRWTVEGHHDGPGRLGDVRIHRAHLEEDAAKLVHAGASGRIHASETSVVDFNRGGTDRKSVV